MLYLILPGDNPPLREIKAGVPGRNPEQKSWRNAAYYLTLWVALSSLHTQLRPICLEMVLLIVG